MSKYWLIFVVCGTIAGCAVSPADDAGSTNDAVSSADKTDPNKTDPNKTDPNKTDPNETDPNKTDPNKTDPNKTDPNKTDPNKTDPNKTDPNKTDPNKTGDQGTPPSGDKGCTGAGDGSKGDPPGACQQLLANAQGNLDAAIKSGDQNQILAAKEKYNAVWNACAEPSTDPGKPTDPAKPEDPCAQVLSGLQAKMDAAAKAGDDALLTALKEKYAALSASCVAPTDPGDPCAQALKGLEVEIDAAAKSGDYTLVTALKEKYLALSASCTSSGNEVPPSNKK